MAGLPVARGERLILRNSRAASDLVVAVAGGGAGFLFGFALLVPDHAFVIFEGGDRHVGELARRGGECLEAQSCPPRGDDMSILFVLIPLAVLMLGVALAAFFWAVGHAQFDDLDTPAVRVLLDDDEDVAR